VVYYCMGYENESNRLVSNSHECLVVIHTENLLLT
jgi:hypothetical protein